MYKSFINVIRDWWGWRKRHPTGFTSIIAGWISLIPLFLAILFTISQGLKGIPEFILNWGLIVSCFSGSFALFVFWPLLVRNVVVINSFITENYPDIFYEKVNFKYKRGSVGEGIVNLVKGILKVVSERGEETDIGSKLLRVLLDEYRADMMVLSDPTVVYLIELREKLLTDVYVHLVNEKLRDLLKYYSDKCSGYEVNLRFTGNVDPKEMVEGEEVDEFFNIVRKNIKASGNSNGCDIKRIIADCRQVIYRVIPEVLKPGIKAQRKIEGFTVKQWIADNKLNKHIIPYKTDYIIIEPISPNDNEYEPSTIIFLGGRVTAENEVKIYSTKEITFVEKFKSNFDNIYKYCSSDYEWG